MKFNSLAFIAFGFLTAGNALARMDWDQSYRGCYKRVKINKIYLMLPKDDQMLVTELARAQKIDAILFWADRNGIPSKKIIFVDCGPES